MNRGRFVEMAQALVGRRCIAYFAGGGGGSKVDVEFESAAGNPPGHTIANSLSDKNGRSPDYSIFIECSWRLDSNEEVLCGAWDDNSEGGPMLSGLEKLVGLRLLDLVISSPGMDADLVFDGYRLRVFCDQVNEVDQEDNYTIFTPELLIVVGRRSVLGEETRGSWKNLSA